MQHSGKPTGGGTVRRLRPLARVVEAELAAKLETPVSLDMTGLYAHDLVGRASAFQRLVGLASLSRKR